MHTDQAAIRIPAATLGRKSIAPNNLKKAASHSGNSRSATVRTWQRGPPAPSTPPPPEEGQIERGCWPRAKGRLNTGNAADGRLVPGPL